MRYSPSNCETNNITKKGVKGELGPKGENGAKGEIGLAGRKGGTGTKGEKGGIGPIGENGTKGDMGPKGEQGSVDSLILQNIIKVICPVKYNKKCFFPIIGRIVDHAEGVVLCQQLGGNLANIYDQIHIDKVMSYIRNRTFVTMWEQFHLGMTYDPLNNKTMLRDGSAAPAGLEWYPSFPRNETDRTGIHLIVATDDTSTFQYLINDNLSNPQEYLRHSLCEM